MSECSGTMVSWVNRDRHKGLRLLWLDDNFGVDDCDAIADDPQLHIVSNRYELVHRLRERGLKAEFSDFVLPANAGHYDIIYLRVAKERFLTRHLLNLSRQCCAPDSALWLLGRKEDGIKTYHDACLKKLGFSGGLQKHKTQYHAELKLSSKNSPCIELDTGSYTRLREVHVFDGPEGPRPYYSKPGVYGWKKLDAGSEFMIAVLDTGLWPQDRAQRCIDLGCGSGHLSLVAAWRGFTNITATDNNATALEACRFNVDAHALSPVISVVPDDCAASFKEKTELILCNPPFHKGFAVNTALSEKFVARCGHLLSKTGRAILVTNVFIGVERISQKYRLHCRELANNGQFKVQELRRG